ncbi:hypothetical protein ACFW91_24905 [Streptomyces asoensis]|uniref:hypothetical protein n=1 Tax=Streptomyces asoensis TaxID=249586 RepID=UPI00369715F4
MPFDLGAPARLSMTVTGDDGLPANAGAMALTVTLPDGTSAVFDPVPPATPGQYKYTYATTQPGRHAVRWVATGANATAYVDVFDVREAIPTWIISLADARQQLKKVAADTSQDESIRRWIGATTAAVEWFVGPVAERTVTETHSVGRVHALALRQIPALALTSVVSVLDGGPSYDVSALDLDGGDGIVRLKGGGYFYGPLRVTYTAGRRIVAENISAAAELILQHLARTQYGTGRPQLGVSDYDVNEPIPGLGYAIPNRALQLLSPDQLPPGMA